MATATHVVHRKNHEKGLPPLVGPAEIFRLHRVFSRAVRVLGERMEQVERGPSAGRRLNCSHRCSRNDLESNGFLICFVRDCLAREGLDVAITFESEELSLFPKLSSNDYALRAIIDPIDGSKAFDNYVCGTDLPLPRPPSAISIAVVCPASDATIVSAVYCFDLGEVFSSVYLGSDPECQPRYCAFRDDTLIPPLSAQPEHPHIEAKKRVLNCDYNARCLEEIARFNLALMDRGLKAAYGGLAGSSATDVINVVRGSFAVCVDVRALFRRGGSVLHLYDVAGVLPIAIARGLSVLLADMNGVPLAGADHAIYTRV
jgi:fructose-1,6-bisphosphatase/inositol monophosphatase family enzyme